MNICMKEFGSQKIIIGKMTAMRTKTIFPDCITKGLCLFYHSAYTADQLLSQLLIEHFDTLPTQCRQIEHMHKGVWYPKKYY